MQSKVDRNRFMNAALSQRICVNPNGDGADTDDDMETSANIYLTPIDECRRQSKSAWLHFPHIELIFLLHAFEGAVASEASAIRQAFDTGEPSWVYYAAIVALVGAITGYVDAKLPAFAVYVL